MSTKAPKHKRGQAGKRAPTKKVQRLGKIESQGAIRSELKDRRPPSFDYNEVEWAEIETAIKAVRQVPLSEDERSLLRKAANHFRSRLDQRKNGTYLTPEQRRNSWKKVQRLCAQLREALAVAAEARYFDDWRAHTIAFIPEHVMRVIVAQLVPTHPDIENVSLSLRPRDVRDLLLVGSCSLSVGDIIDLIEDVETEALEVGSYSFLWKSHRLVSYTGRLDPSVIFYQRILRLWTDDFGGKLTTTYDSGAGKIRGPLGKYFFAVARPVMDDDAPSPQSFRDIVDRQKQFLKWWVLNLKENGGVFKPKEFG